MADLPGQLNRESGDLPEGGLVKPFLEHLEDLRWTLVKCVIALAVSMGLCLFFVRELIQFIELPLIWSGVTKDPSKFLLSFGVADSFTITFKVAIMGGLLLSIPLILFFIGQFVIPALTSKERRFLWPAFTGGAIMFLLGVAACYFLLLPQTFAITYQFSSYLGFQAQWTIESYMSFTVQFMIGIGLGCETPVVILVLVRLGIVTDRFLRKYRPHIIVAIFIIAAVITPTTDIFTLCAVAVPMCILYEGCIWIAWWMCRKRSVGAEPTA